MAKRQLEQAKRRTEHYLAIIYSFEVQLLDQEFINKLHYFCSFSMAWLIRVVDPRGLHPQQTIELPLPEQIPDRFAMLPEYLFEDIVMFYENVGKALPSDEMAKLPLDQLLSFIVVFLATPYLKNPYLVRLALSVHHLEQEALMRRTERQARRYFVLQHSTDAVEP